MGLSKREAKAKFTAETKDFTEAINSAKSELSKLKNQLSLNAKEMELNGKSFDSLERKHELIQESITATSAKIEALCGKLSKAEEIYGENSKEANYWSSQLAKAGTEMYSLNKALDNCEDDMKAFKKAEEESATATSKLSDKISEQKDELADLKKKYSDLVLEQGDASEEAEKLRKEILDLSSELNNNERRLKEASDAADKYDNSLREVDDATSIASEGFTVMKGALADLVADGIREAISAVKEFATETVNVGKEFSATMSEIAAIGGLDLGTEQGIADLEALEQKAMEVGASTIYSASEVAQGFTELSQAGWRTEEMLTGIVGVTDLAAAGNIDLARASEIVTTALNGFGEGAEFSAEFADVLAHTAAETNVTVDEMGETFKYVSAIAGTMGYSVQDISVALGVMADSGIKGTQAGTTLRGMMSRLASPTAKASDLMADLGIQISNADGTMKPFSEVVDILRDSFSGLSEAEQVAAAKTLVGQEAMTGMLSLVNVSSERYNELSTSVEHCAGAAGRMADVMTDNLAGDLEEVGGKVESLQLKLFDDLEPGLRECTVAVGDFVEGLEDIDVSEFSEDLADLAKGILPGVGKALKFIVENFKPLTTAVWAGATAFATFSAGLAIANLVTKLTTAVKAGTTALGLMKIALASNPIGAVAVAVGLLVTGLGVLIATQEDATESTEHLTDSEQRLIDKANETAEAFREQKEATSEALGNIDGELGYVSRLSDELSRLADENGKVSEANQGRAKFIIGELNEALGTEITMTDGVIQEYEKLEEAVNKAVEAKRLSAYFDAYEDDYATAIREQAGAFEALTLTQKDFKAQQDRVNDAQKEYDEINKKVTENAGKYNMVESMRLAEADKNLKAEQAILDEKKAALDQSASDYGDYTNTIMSYEQAMLFSNQGSTDLAIAEFQRLAGGYSVAVDGIDEATQREIDILYQGAIEAGLKAEFFRTQYEAGVEGYTEGMVAEAEKGYKDALGKFSTAYADANGVGNDLGDGMTTGMRNKKATVETEAKSLVERILSAMRTSADSHSPSRKTMVIGGDIGQGLIIGINGTRSNLLTTVGGLVSEAISSLSQGLSTFRSTALNGTNFSWSIPKPSIPSITVSWWESVKSIGGRIARAIAPSFNLTWHAKGGIFKKPTLLPALDGIHGVGEAGAEAITPLSALQDFIDNSFSRWIGSPAFATGTSYNFYLNGAVVNSTDKMESVAKEFIEELVRLGGM